MKAYLPWNQTEGYNGKGLLPMLQTSSKRSLMQMVEDDTDEIYREDELEYDEHVLAQLMLRMRQNLEIFLGQALENDFGTAYSDQGAYCARDVRNRNLKHHIDIFAKLPDATPAFVDIMHKIRDIGNTAAHRSPSDPKLSQEECEEVVRMYRCQKETYESKRQRQRAAVMKSGAEQASDTVIETVNEETKCEIGLSDLDADPESLVAVDVSQGGANMIPSAEHDAKKNIPHGTNSRPTQPKRRRKGKGNKKKR